MDGNSECFHLVDFTNLRLLLALEAAVVYHILNSWHNWIHSLLG